MALTIDELAENFELLGDWEERYAYIIDLGRKLPPLPEALKTAQTKVDGCISQVWLVPSINRDVTPPKLSFQADSDAQIVKGLVAILIELCSDRTAEEIAAVDIDEAFRRCQLEEHLSPNRRNGFFAMVGKIKAYAAAASSS